MSESIRYPQAAAASEASPLAGFDRIVASMKPAVMARRSTHAPTAGLTADAAPPSLSPSALPFASLKRTNDSSAAFHPKLAQKDREIKVLQRQVQDLMSSRRQLEKTLHARDAKTNALEQNAEASARRISGLAAQLKMTRAELERCKQRALTDHRQQEQRIAVLEQTVSRKMGLGRLPIGIAHEVLVNPLTGRPDGESALGGPVNLGGSHPAVLEAAAVTQQNVEGRINDSVRLESLAEMLEHAFDLQDTSAVPQNVLNRLEIGVEGAVELLDAMTQHFDELCQGCRCTDSRTNIGEGAQLGQSGPQQATNLGSGAGSGSILEYF